MPWTRVRIAANVATVGFMVMGCFQLLLAAGVPLGRSAFGGAEVALPPALRVASLVSAGLFALALYVVRSRAGLLGSRGEAWPVRFGLWAFVALFAVSTLANVASSSPWKRFLMAPLALVLTACCVLVARTRPARGEG